MQRLLLLLVAAGLLVSAGCSGRKSADEIDAVKSDSFDELRIAVGETVADADRQAIVVSQINEMEAMFVEGKSVQLAFLDELHELHRNYYSTPEQFEALIDATNAEFLVIEKRLVAINRAIVAATTAEEYESLGKLRLNAFESSVAAQETLDAANREAQ